MVVPGTVWRKVEKFGMLIGVGLNCPQNNFRVSRSNCQLNFFCTFFGLEKKSLTPYWGQHHPGVKKKVQFCQHFTSYPLCMSKVMQSPLTHETLLSCHDILNFSKNCFCLLKICPAFIQFGSDNLKTMSDKNDWVGYIFYIQNCLLGRR